jgi:serine/threonine protein phosphatase PrpC
LHFELAEVSLLGDREENQDRSVVRTDRAGVLLVVADGMGGHAGGALAAEVALDSLCRSFAAADAESEPRQFLQEALAYAHDDVVRIGEEVAAGSRPRATCAVCLVQDGRATWAHVGDSRIYFARGGKVVTRTRDHTPIESLLQDGLISEEEIAGHPMRHYVEYCLGGFAERPLITVSETAGLETGDILLVCSDGLWSGVSDAEIGAGPEDGAAMQDWLARLAGRAVRAGTPYSDNTTVVALRVPVN